MFFSSKTVLALIDDHEKIRIELEYLRDIDFSLQDRRAAFMRLIPSLVSHTQREEKTIYSFMNASLNENLKHMALEGIEEHLMADRLIKEMNSDQTSTEAWSAKAKVLAELLKHHIDEEEIEVFPLLKKNLNETTDEVLLERYQESGPQPPFSEGGWKRDSSVPQPRSPAEL